MHELYIKRDTPIKGRNPVMGFYLRDEAESEMAFGTVQHFGSYHGPLDTVVDIGAHVGELTIAALQAGAKMVWAFEPDADNYRYLVMNIVGNGYLSHAIPIPYAVWSKSGTTKLCQYVGGNTGQRSVMFIEGKTIGTTVPCVNLETILSWTGPVDYMKMDIEGAEHIVLPATPIGVMAKVKTLDLDVHDITMKNFFDTDIDMDVLFDYLRRCGFDPPPLPPEADTRNQWMLLERT